MADTLSEYVGSFIILLLITLVCGTLLWVALPASVAPATFMAWRNVLGLVFSIALAIRAFKAVWRMP